MKRLAVLFIAVMSLLGAAPTGQTSNYDSAAFIKGVLRWIREGQSDFASVKGQEIQHSGFYRARIGLAGFDKCFTLFDYALKVWSVDCETRRDKPSRTQSLFSQMRSDLMRELPRSYKFKDRAGAKPEVDATDPNNTEITLSVFRLNDKADTSSVFISFYASASKPWAEFDVTPFDFIRIRQLEITFHEGVALVDIGRVMGLFADDATLSVADGKTYAGKDQIETYFSKIEPGFQPKAYLEAYTLAARCILRTCTWGLIRVK